MTKDPPPAKVFTTPANSPIPTRIKIEFTSNNIILKQYNSFLKVDDIITIFLSYKSMYICRCFGEMAEWSNAAVLKTVEGHTSGGSNPSFSAKNPSKC